MLMLKNWLRKRRMAKLNSADTPWDYKLDNQSCIKPFTRQEPKSFEMDFMTFENRCGTAERLVEILEQSLVVIGARGTLPKFRDTGRIKGGVKLTEYLTKKDDYPYPIRIADEDIFKLLERLSEALQCVKDEKETSHSYYFRKLKPYVIEAIEFRLYVNTLD